MLAPSPIPAIVQGILPPLLLAILFALLPLVLYGENFAICYVSVCLTMLCSFGVVRMYTKEIAHVFERVSEVLHLSLNVCYLSLSRFRI